MWNKVNKDKDIVRNKIKIKLQNKEIKLNANKYAKGANRKMYNDVKHV